ncbi:Acid phosphatase 1 [Hordeum vulgare]|nr:Acid phosphatase 1 [Hordeum vulgare]
MFIQRFISEHDLIQEKNQTNVQQAPRQPRQIHMRPSAPPAGYAKIHTDGVVVRNRGGSRAVVCHNDAGNFLGRSTLVIDGQIDPATLEVIACREALALVEDLLLHDFVISSYCKQVVNDIKLGNQGRYGSII